MAASLGVSPRQLRRLLDELKTANYLEIEVRKGRGPHQDLSRNRSRRSGRGAAEPVIRDRSNPRKAATGDHSNARQADISDTKTGHQ